VLVTDHEDLHTNTMMKTFGNGPGRSVLLIREGGFPRREGCSLLDWPGAEKIHIRERVEKLGIEFEKRGSH